MSLDFSDDSNNDTSAFDPLFQDGGLDFSPLDLESRRTALKLYQMRYPQDSPTVNPLTNESWEGIPDENTYLIMGSWPEVDAIRIIETMENGTISYEHFALIFEYWRERQYSNKKVSEKQIRLLFEQNTKKYPWRLLHDLFLERDVITIPEDYDVSDLNIAAVDIEDSESTEFEDLINLLVRENWEYFDGNTNVLNARTRFINEIRGLSYTADQMAAVIFRHFTFIEAGRGGYTRSTAMLKASGFIRLDVRIKALGSGHSDMLQKFVHDKLDELNAGADTEL